ncbi:MAG TPA: RNA polymerase sigma factor [Pirellulales bacterium]|jgi:RNA polymerase sigma-70 factor (ECF subfamily)|nr:RNA polymerase sigma factor [Pirellulales bacterium]
MSENRPVGASTNAQALADLSDEQLLLRYGNAREDDVFRELVHRYERELYSYLYRYTHDSGLSEDVFQATFLRLHQKIEAFEPGRPVRPWIYSIATHLAIDALRKAGRRHTVSLDVQYDEAEAAASTLLDLVRDTMPQPLKQISDEERSAWARQAVAELPDYLRQVVLLIYFQGLTYQEAAEILAIPLGTVKSRMHAALVKLHRAWRKSHRDAEEE